MTGQSRRSGSRQDYGIGMTLATAMAGPERLLLKQMLNVEKIALANSLPLT
jgi:hypothetical protein